MRHGPQVEMPPTARGPFTVSDRALHEVLRRAVDAVPGARSLGNDIEHADPASGSGRGLVRAVRCRLSVGVPRPSADDATLPAAAAEVRRSVTHHLQTELGVGGCRIDIHIEDIHREDPHEH